jgi:hypothetical protein
VSLDGTLREHLGLKLPTTGLSFTLPVASKASPAVATEQGLLWLVANALEEPWTTALEPLVETSAQRRFARVAMIASGLTTIPRHLMPPIPIPGDRAARRADEKDTSDRKTPFTTARTLLSIGRLVEYDDIVRWPVRAIELYGELLDELNPTYAQRFLSARGMDVRTWVIKVCSLANLIWKKIAEGEVCFPILDISSPGQNSGNPMIAVIRALATSQGSFENLMKACRRQARDPVLAFQPIRQFPILDLGADRYVVLHKDFLLAAADDGIWYALNDASPSPSRFGSDFGVALERYVGRILGRCAAASATAVARIPESGKAGVRRCDFAWRIGANLVLLDSKRTGLNAAHLMGGGELDDRLEQDLGGACEQFLSTKRSFEGGELADVLHVLGVPEGWRPHAYVPIAVTHRPVFMHFSSAQVLLERKQMTATWDREFSAWPTFWSIQDLELLEASVPHIDLAGLVGALLRREPATTGGVPPYLTWVGYTGMCTSEYYDRRRDELIAPYLLQDP